MNPIPIPRQPPVLGFTSGSGAAVTQLTSKSTAVTIDAICGQITTDAEALAAGAEVSFTVNNAFVAATDVVVANIASGATTRTYMLGVQAIAAGSFELLLENVSGTSRSTAIVINFVVIKGAAA